MYCTNVSSSVCGSLAFFVLVLPSLCFRFRVPNVKDLEVPIMSQLVAKLSHVFVQCER